MNPSAASSVWEVKELRSNVLGHLYDIHDGKKAPLLSLLTINQGTFLDVAEVIYEKLGDISNHLDDPIKDTIVDYLEERGCAYARINQYTSFVRTHRIQEPVTVDKIAQAKLLRLYPNLRVISFDIPLGSRPVEALIYRTGGEETLVRLILTPHQRLEGISSIHSLYQHAGNSGSQDGKFRLEGIMANASLQYHGSRSNAHIWFYKSLPQPTLPWLQILLLGCVPLSLKELEDIIKSVPHVLELELGLTNPDNSTTFEKDLVHVLRNASRLRSLGLMDCEGNERIDSWVEFVDQLLVACPTLMDLELPVVFTVPPCEGDWMYVEDQPVRYPTGIVAPRWQLRQLQLKLTADSRDDICATALIFFFATAISVTAALGLTYSDSELLKAGHSDEDERKFAETEAKFEMWAHIIDVGRSRICEQLHCGVPWELREPGWKMLEDKSTEREGRRSTRARKSGV